MADPAIILRLDAQVDDHVKTIVYVTGVFINIWLATSIAEKIIDKGFQIYEYYYQRLRL